MNPSRQATLSAVLTFVAFCVAQPACGQAAPGVLRGRALNKAFSAYPSQNHIYCDRLAGDAPGVFTCCLTTMSGPRTPPDVVIGAYDQTKGTFTPTKEAAALNTSRWDYGLWLEPKLGRYAVLTRGNGAPTEYLFAVRARPGVPFPAAVKISGVPAQTFGLSLGYVGRKLKLFFAPFPYKTAVMQDLDITNPAAPKLVGSPVVVARPSAANRVIGLAFPITGRDGDVEGLLVSEGPTPASFELVFQAGLDPSHHGQTVVAGCGTNCSVTYPTVAGGRLLFSIQVPRRPQAIHDVEVAWLLGDVVAPGGTADITGAVSSVPPALTLIFGSTRVRHGIKLPSPLDVGAFALDPAATWVLGAFGHRDASERGGMSFPIPNDRRLVGTDAAIQGLSFDAKGKPLAWTNTALLTVR